MGQLLYSTPLRHHSHLAAYQTYHITCALSFIIINYLSRILALIWLPIIFSINVVGILSWDSGFPEIPRDSGDLKVALFVKRPTTRYSECVCVVYISRNFKARFRTRLKNKVST